jgi:hypothetical protein
MAGEESGVRSVAPLSSTRKLAASSKLRFTEDSKLGVFLRAFVVNNPPVSSPRSIIQLTRSFIRDQRMRRSLMFYVSLGSVLMVFVGAVLIDTPLRRHPIAFVVWWAVCAWLMLTSLLLALFDMLAIRAAARRERRELARRIFNDNHPDEDTH